MLKLLLTPTTVLAISLSLASCVKFEIKPGGVIGDTVDAGKEAYQTIKRKHGGEEERVYSHAVSKNANLSNAVNVAYCKQEIFEIIAASNMAVIETLSESSAIDGDKNLVECTVNVVVKSNN